MNTSNWIILKTDANIELMAKTLGISPVLARVLANRNIRSKNTAIKYLYPYKKFMYDAALFKDIDKAATIIKKAIRSDKKIAIYGDYDVDGVMSTVILIKTLSLFTDSLIYYIPDRESEGYGMNVDAISKLHAQNISMIIACDNGISALQEISLAKDFGMDVVIFDHHEPPFTINNSLRTENLPQADAIVDHKQSACTYPFRHLCAAAICYKFSEYFLKYMNRHPSKEFYDELFIFAAIATFCDVVSLTDENRIFAKNGLALINQNITNIGLKSLIEERNIKGKKINSFDIGFIIGPCINAVGRLETAALAVDLFLTDSLDKAKKIASRLVDLNDERKRLTQNATTLALKTATLPEYKNDKVYVFYNDSIHESIAGIVAGRVREFSNHPVIMLTKSGNIAKGSARSIENYNIFEELTLIKDLFEKFGGHEMAAGMSLKIENIPTLRQKLNNACKLSSHDFIKKIYIDAETCFSDITFKLAEEINLMEPFGKDNYEPVFVTKEVLCSSIEPIGSDKKTLKFSLVQNSTTLKAIAFGLMNKLLKTLANDISQSFAYDFQNTGKINSPLKMDIAFNISINEYNGAKSLQLKLVDFKNIKF